MASTLARTAMRATAMRQPAAPTAIVRRHMSGDLAGDKAHALEEMIKWKKIAFGMVVGTTAGGAMIIATEEKHGTVPDDAVLPSFMKIRTKPFPWYCSDCAFLDVHCFKQCKDERGGNVIPKA